MTLFVLAAESHSLVSLIGLSAILMLHLALDFTGHQGESLLDVIRVLGRRLEEADVENVCQVLALVVRDGTMVLLEIFFVADKDLGNVLIRVLIDLLHPLADLGERVSISQIVRDDNTVCASIVARRDSLETILTSGIPNLQLDGLTVDLDRANLEVDTNGGHEAIMEDIIGESEQERRLADTGVTNQKNLEKVIAIGCK